MFKRAFAAIAIIAGLAATATVTLPTAEAQAAEGRNAAFVAGTITGLTLGAVAQTVDWRGNPRRHYRGDRRYRHYRKDRRHRGYRYDLPRRHYRPVRPRHYARPRPWSGAWYSYCHSKYRSFNPRTGYYTTYSGRKRFCR
ncbi:BA14K-like protein [Cohaesibacter sp. ES.047]|uniref:BA14K family protein n=1 Tax=Cohaesibacter sp. ES.047 TaxID=1798205 RepID=UPI000BB92393|nr:BA14K family protein [Cohaesibacter sp. ES.047]SNY94196.1 BA14K-like protein [Cohaesibacter sp. ES.047]